MAPAVPGGDTGDGADRRRGYYPGAVLDPNVLDLEQVTRVLSDHASYEHCWLIHPPTG